VRCVDRSKALTSTESSWNREATVEIGSSVLRQLAYGYVTGYLENGNSALAIYLDSAKPTVVATEFESMIDRMPTLTSNRETARTKITAPAATATPMKMPSRRIKTFLHLAETGMALPSYELISYFQSAPSRNEEE
jgi:hypothetical protein